MFKHYANNNVCHLCSASKVDPERLYTDHGPTARWQAERVSHEDYVNNFGPGRLPRLARVKGFFLRRVFIDSMHTVDMGVAPHVVGNILWEIVTTAEEFGTDSRAKRLERAYIAYRQFCSEIGVTCVSTTWKPEKLNKNSATDYPFMKAKAVECKKMVPFCYALCEKYNSGSEHDQQRMAVIWGLLEYYKTIKRAGRYLLLAELEHLQRVIYVLLKCYNSLRIEAIQLDDRRLTQPAWSFLAQLFV